VDLHWRDLIAHGADPRKLNSLLTWHENDLWTPRERAALKWAESLTLVADTHAPDADFEALKAHFSDSEIVELTYVVALMNTWNRVAVGMRMAIPANG
jgi:alkylhydroperoxidase family enzyme